jgi:hypothetical protein
MAICAFMCYFFLVFFKYRQNEIAIRQTVYIIFEKKTLSLKMLSLG